MALKFSSYSLALVTKKLKSKIKNCLHLPKAFCKKNNDSIYGSLQ